jgi:hypothetical protein
MRRFLLTSMLLLTVPAAALAQATPTPNDPTAVVRDYVSAQNRGDIDRMLALVADQLELRTGLTTARISESTSSENKAQLRARFNQMNERFPQARSEILELMTQGGVVITKERMDGLPGGVSDTGIAMYRVRNGKIESIWLVSSAAAAGDR